MSIGDLTLASRCSREISGGADTFYRTSRSFISVEMEQTSRTANDLPAILSKLVKPLRCALRS